MTNDQYNLDSQNLTVKSLELEIKKLKELHKNFGGGLGYEYLSEEDKKTKNELHQNMLEKEYELQETKKKLAGAAYVGPKKGDWIVGKNRWGYKRYKIIQDENAGW